MNFGAYTMTYRHIDGPQSYVYIISYYLYALFFVQGENEFNYELQKRKSKRCAMNIVHINILYIPIYYIYDKRVYRKIYSSSSSLPPDPLRTNNPGHKLPTSSSRNIIIRSFILFFAFNGTRFVLYTDLFSLR